MKRPLTHRLLALAGSVALGLAGAVALAGPAQAHHTEISGIADCQPDGRYLIKWTVLNGNWEGRHAQITGLKSSPADAVEGLLNEAISANTDGAGPAGTIVGTQLVPGSTTSATLTVDAVWFDPDEENPKQVHPNTDSGVAKIEKGDRLVPLDGKCVPTPRCVDAASAEYEHTFDGPKGEATVAVKGDLPLCEGGSQDFLLVSYYAPSNTATWPQYSLDHAVGTIDKDTRKVELKVDVPKCFTQVDLVWGGERELLNPMTANGPRYNNKKLGSPGAPGNRSKGVPGWYNGGTGKCTAPAAKFVPSCDGTVTVHVSNDGKYAADFTIAYGDTKKTVTVAPGKSDDSVKVPAGAGEIVVTEQGKEVGKYTWARPADCPLPTMKVESTCDSFVLKVSNPENNLPVQAVATYGSQEKKVTVAPGATETVTFTAGSATTAKVVFTGYDFELVGKHIKPSTGCDTLPQTGTKITTYVISGLLLVALGVGVFMLARRRRLNLTEV
ncbi:LPXTG cell wall anchor domain-containing protein [Catellatospora sichuanensis]|uniref:LPXTG cell wall anchor domain-containing protein n=1 Tax=Catellatospora sichuanensis TaxID=1969805 RepID=UPI001182E424|nr:LPXTG cell wall anchor domain-containing protein [Catellatospora sichuanensis]